MTGNTIRLSGYRCPECGNLDLFAIGGEIIDEPEKVVCLATECEWEKDVEHSQLSAVLETLPREG